MAIQYGAILLVSYGGPDGPRDVMPFLENVTRGKNVPPERLRQVAARYRLFGGVSPINAQNRALLVALVAALNAHGPTLPVYWGNRYWHPMLAETLRQMAEDGIGRALAFFTSPYSSHSSCRQYLEEIERARAAVGPGAPRVDKLRAYYNHPGFIETMIDRTRAALDEVPEDGRDAARVVFAAHSIPRAMADACRYRQQLREVCRLVSEALELDGWELAYQSRSGPPSRPWLEPDIRDVLRRLGAGGEVADVLVAPIGFVSEHFEVVYDLDVEARAVCEKLGLNMIRAATAGTHPRFVRMIRELILERTGDSPNRPALGRYGPAPDVCPENCCRYRRDASGEAR